MTPRCFSLTAFVGSQVVIDLESGYHLVRQEWPVHRLLHTLPVAVPVGLACGTATWFLGRWFERWKEPELRADVQPFAALIGGFLGGLSHPVLDAVMHTDVQLFWPLSSENPLLNAVDLELLHGLCFLSGVIGAGLLFVRAVRKRRPGAGMD